MSDMKPCSFSCGTIIVWTEFDVVEIGRFKCEPCISMDIKEGTIGLILTKPKMYIDEPDGVLLASRDNGSHKWVEVLVHGRVIHTWIDYIAPL